MRQPASNEIEKLNKKHEFVLTFLPLKMNQTRCANHGKEIKLGFNQINNAEGKATLMPESIITDLDCVF